MWRHASWHPQGHPAARLLGEADAARVLVVDEEALGAEARVVGVVALGAQVAAANTTPARP